MKLKSKPSVEVKDSDMYRAVTAHQSLEQSFVLELRDWSNLNLANLGGPWALLATLRLQQCWYSWAGVPAAFWLELLWERLTTIQRQILFNIWTFDLEVRTMCNQCLIENSCSINWMYLWDKILCHWNQFRNEDFFFLISFYILLKNVMLTASSGKFLRVLLAFERYVFSVISIVT